jgi:cytoskeletal protein RodZ
MEMNNEEPVAEMLRGMREARGWDLEKVSRKTYIRQTYLAAIEEGRYAEIGDPVFVKGFIRNYAELLGMDGDMTVMKWNKEQKTAAAPNAGKARAGAALASHSEAVEVAQPKTKRRPFTVLERAIITLGIGAALAIWAWMVYL